MKSQKGIQRRHVAVKYGRYYKSHILYGILYAAYSMVHIIWSLPIYGIIWAPLFFKIPVQAVSIAMDFQRIHQF